MANYERGVYEPSDEVRVFDGSEEEDDVEGSRLPLLIVLALLVLAMFAGVVWLAYTQGVARGRGETPVLAAAGGPERVAPQQAGGANVPYQGFKIYEQPAPPDDSADAAATARPSRAAGPAPPRPAAAARRSNGARVAAPAPKARSWSPPGRPSSPKALRPPRRQSPAAAACGAASNRCRPDPACQFPPAPPSRAP